MKTAAAYIRVSTEEQTEFSPASQLKAIKRYAADKELSLPEELIFSDSGISGRSASKRPGFQKMIAAAKCVPPPFEVILIWKFSRFARSRQDSIIYKTLLRRECGIEVISVSEQLGTDNTSVLIEALIEAMDEYYSLNLAEEVRRGMQEKFSRGGVVSQPPFGYIMGNNYFVPDPDSAPVVKHIFASYLSGRSISHIARELNELGITTARGSQFERRSVEYILTNPVYTGKLRRSISGSDRRDRFHQNPQNTAISQGQHQPIISAEDFQLAQEIYHSNRRSRTLSQGFDHSGQLLRGLVRCSACGGTLVYQGASGCLQCHNYAKGKCSVSHGISARILENNVINQVCKDFPGVINITIPGHFPASLSLNGLIARQEKMLEKARAAYISGVDTLEEYTRNKVRITGNIQVLQQKSTAEPIVQKKLKTSIEILRSEQVDTALKSLILRTLIESIVLIRPKSSLEISYLL